MEEYKYQTPAMSTESLPVALQGPLRIDHPTIKAAITESRPGVYVLVSEHSATGEFEYVGRADQAVNEKILAWMNSFGWVYWAYADSAEDAYQKECRLYHQINPGANARHPKSPEGSALNCPECADRFN